MHPPEVRTSTYTARPAPGYIGPIALPNGLICHPGEQVPLNRLAGKEPRLSAHCALLLGLYSDGTMYYPEAGRAPAEGGGPPERIGTVGTPYGTAFRHLPPVAPRFYAPHEVGMAEGHGSLAVSFGGAGGVLRARLTGTFPTNSRSA